MKSNKELRLNRLRMMTMQIPPRHCLKHHLPCAQILRLVIIVLIAKPLTIGGQDLEIQLMTWYSALMYIAAQGISQLMRKL
jgi:hypothetical protein